MSKRNTRRPERARVFLPLLAIGLAVLTWTSRAPAQGYPAKTIRIVVAYPPGGPNDIVGRTVGQKMAELLGQSIIIDNRSGASGNIGTELVAKASPDGYTLLMAAGAVTIAPSIYPSLAYDIVRDFAPVSLAARGAFVLVLHPSVPAKTVKELIDLAKSRSSSPLICASAGPGAPPFLAAALFQSMTGVKLTDVPYKGGGPVLPDLLGGQVDLYFAGISLVLPHIQSGRLRALAVTTRKRFALLPNIPTLDESGLSGFDISTWFGLLAPAGTAEEIVNKLHDTMIKAVATPGVRDIMQTAGLMPESSTPEQFGNHIKNEIRKFAAIVKTSGAKVD